MGVITRSEDVMPHLSDWISVEWEEDGLIN